MIFLNEEEIKLLLNWNDTLEATEAALKAESLHKSAVAPRVFAPIFTTPKWMIAMPGYLDDEKYGGWACKTLTSNSQLKVVHANIMLFDQTTGELKAILSGMEITNWRTAAASAIATKYLHTPTGKSQKILAIFGCGEQGIAHAHCFYHCFQFDEIRLWNRTSQKANSLANELNVKYNTTKFKAITDKEECARGADVINTTTTPGSAPILQYQWLKEGVHINAVGVSVSNPKSYELDKEVYKFAHVYVDNWPGAKRELDSLKFFGALMKAEIGDVILGNSLIPKREQLTVFQSLGMASEDCAMVRMIFDLYMKQKQQQ